MLITGIIKKIMIRGTIKEFSSCIIIVLIKLCPNNPNKEQVIKVRLGIKIGKNILASCSFLTIYLYQKKPDIQAAGKV